MGHIDAKGNCGFFLRTLQFCSSQSYSPNPSPPSNTSTYPISFACQALLPVGRPHRLDKPHPLGRRSASAPTVAIGSPESSSDPSRQPSTPGRAPPRQHSMYMSYEAISAINRASRNSTCQYFHVVYLILAFLIMWSTLSTL